MAPNLSLLPLPENRFDRACARHLLWRVGFGGTPEEVNELAALGREKAVKRLVDYASGPAAQPPALEIDPDILRVPTPQEQQRYKKARRSGDQDFLDARRRAGLAARRQDRKVFGKLKAWWFARIVQTPRPAEERLVLLWHGHFASSYRSVRDAYLMQVQNEFFRRHASGSFADLARGIVRDPAMLKYLNNNQNNKKKPNENLARELMELFTLGVGRYTEQDIKQGARALTGYTFTDNDFVFRDNNHDDGIKKILGRTGNFDGDSFVELLLRQEACSKFVALKLYDHFVADVGDVYEAVPGPQRRVIDLMAKRLRRDNYRLKPVLTQLFSSQHFYDASVIGKKIKDPVQLVVGTVRALGAPVRDERVIDKAMHSMGQKLFEPPTVDGWDGGRLWINTSTLFVRQNVTTYLLSGKRPDKKKNIPHNIYDPQALIAGLEDRSAAAVVDHLIDHAVGPHVPSARREPLHRFFQERGGPTHNPNLVALLCLITAMPEYQLC